MRAAIRDRRPEMFATRVHACVYCCVLSLMVGSCDPCAATVGCTGSPTVAVVGQIVDEITGAPVKNVRIEMRQQSGVTLQPPTATTTSQADGAFQLELPATDVGEAIVTLTVATPGKPPYEVPDVRLRASTAAGTATVLHPWVSAHPSFPYVLVLFHDPANEDGVANASVEFRRTGGPLMLSGGTPVSTVQGTTDGAGWVYLLNGITADRVGAVVGDLIIQVPPTGRTVILSQVTWPAVPRFRQPTTIVVVGVGP